MPLTLKKSRLRPSVEAAGIEVKADEAAWVERGVVSREFERKRGKERVCFSLVLVLR